MKRKDILLILVPSFIFVLAWMGFSIYHGFINSTISEALNIQIIPINPTFDTATISKLKNRTHVNPIYEINPSLIITPTPGVIVDDQSASKSATTPTPTPKIDDSKNGQSTTGGVLSQ